MYFFIFHCLWGDHARLTGLLVYAFLLAQLTGNLNIHLKFCWFIENQLKKGPYQLVITAHRSPLM